MGLPNGWDVNELHRGFGEVFVGLALPAVDSIPEIDFDTGTPDEIANPDAFSIGYTNGGWDFTATPTFEEDRVDEEEDPVADFITTNEVTLAAEMRQVKNLERLAFLMPGGTHVPESGGIEKLTGGGKQTFSYFTAMLIVPDQVDAGVYWSITLYRCLNRGGIAFGFGRTRSSAATLSLSGRAVSGRTAGDRTFAIARHEAPGS